MICTVQQSDRRRRRNTALFLQTVLVPSHAAETPAEQRSREDSRVGPGNSGAPHIAATTKRRREGAGIQRGMRAAKASGPDTKKRASAASVALTGERRATLRLEPIRAFARVLFDDDLHAKRVESLANGVAGVLNAAMLTIHAIGQAYAAMAHIERLEAV